MTSHNWTAFSWSQFYSILYLVFLLLQLDNHSSCLPLSFLIESLAGNYPKLTQIQIVYYPLNMSQLQLEFSFLWNRNFTYIAEDGCSWNDNRNILWQVELWTKENKSEESNATEWKIKKKGYLLSDVFCYLFYYVHTHLSPSHSNSKNVLFEKQKWSSNTLTWLSNLPRSLRWYVSKHIQLWHWFAWILFLNTLTYPEMRV